MKKYMKGESWFSVLFWLFLIAFAIKGCVPLLEGL